MKSHALNSAVMKLLWCKLKKELQWFKCVYSEKGTALV